MSARTDYFSRAAGRVDVERLTRRFVVVFGVGSVGSVMALELARSGVGHMVLADGDRLAVGNLSRHALPDHYVGVNKAEAMASHLAINVPRMDVDGAPFHVDDSFSDRDIDLLMAPADLIVIATDERASQRRLARRALAMDIPAVVPGLYADRGGEVFAQLAPGEACFTCWDDFRNPEASVRGATSINADALSVIQQAVYTSLALLDPRSRHARDLAPGQADPRPHQLFQIHPGAALIRATVTRRPGCVGCAVGPSPVSGEQRWGGVWGATRHFGRGRVRSAAAGWPLILSGEQTPPVIASIKVSEPVVLEGQSVTVSWEVENSSRVTIDGHGDHPSVGSLEVAVKETTTFRLTAVNPFGETSALSPSVRTVQLPRLTVIPIPGLPASRQQEEHLSEPPRVEETEGPRTEMVQAPERTRSLREVARRSLPASSFATSPALRTVMNMGPSLPPSSSPVTFGLLAAVRSVRRATRQKRRQP